MMNPRSSHNLLNLIHVFLLLKMADFAVSEVHLVSKDQVYRLERGSDVTLGCEFITSRFNLFDNPILWRKVQLDEDCQLNMMSNVLEPFRSRGRFKVAFSSTANKHKFNLSISDVAFEDVGNYTCEVNGPQNTLLGSVTYTIFVKAPLEILSINSIDDFGPYQDASQGETASDHSNPPKPKHFNFTSEEESELIHSGGSSLLLEEPTRRKTTHNHRHDIQKISPPTKSQLIFGNEIPKFDLNTEESMTFDTSHVDRNLLPIEGVTTEDRKHHAYNSAHSNSLTDFKDPSANHIPSYNNQPSQNDREANFSENQSGRLSCLAGGLYPPSSLTLLIGSRNITSSLRYCLKAYPGKGIKGLRLIHFEVVRWSEKFWATPEDDGQYLQCNAAFAGSPPLVNNFTCIRMVVNYAPKVTCPSVLALLNQLEAKLSCRISSQPGVASINWLSPRSGSSVNSSTIQQTMESSEYTLQNRIVDGVIETSLIIRRVQERHFGVYNITAENGFEIGWGTADLRKRETHLSPKSWAFVEHSSNQALKRGVGSHYYLKSSTLTPNALGSMTTTIIITIITMIIIISCVPLPVIFWSSS